MQQCYLRDLHYTSLHLSAHARWVLLSQTELCIFYSSLTSSVISAQQCRKQKRKKDRDGSVERRRKRGEHVLSAIATDQRHIRSKAH